MALEVAQYNSNGTLDGTFGTGGIVVLSPYNGLFYGAAVVAQADGKLVIACTEQTASNPDALFLRLNLNGTLDTTYANLGVLSLATQYGIAFNSAAIMSNGSVILAGYDNALVFNAITTYTVVYRFLPTGQPDPSFGGSGFIGDAEGVALQPDGKIILSAITSSGVSVARLTLSGAFDPTFGTSGIMTLSGSSVSSAAIQSDGKIVLTGRSDASHGFIERLNSNGSVDPTFGVSGRVITQTGSPNGANYFNAVAIQKDGRIVAAGVSSDSLTNAQTGFTIARFIGLQPTLALDPNSDSGISNSDQITNSTTPTFDLPAIPGYYERVYRNGTLVSPAYVSSSTVTLSTQPTGVSNYTMTVVDSAGNESTPTAAYPVTFDTTPPAATGPVGAVLASAALSYSFTVTYADNNAVVNSTLGNNNILVTNSSGYRQLATFVSASTIYNAATVTITYQITPPAGGWGPAGSVYTFALQPNSVTDVAGNPAASTNLGSVIVGFVPPGQPQLQATTDSGTSSIDGITDFDNSSAANALQFLVSNTIVGATIAIYADKVAIGSAVATDISTVVITNGAFALANGVHMITARQSIAGLQTADSTSISITVDTIPPTASVMGALIAAGANYDFNVVYADAFGVNAATLGGNNFLLASAAGYSQLATLISYTPTNNGAVIVATYQAFPPIGGWAAGSSSYNITLQPSQVSDIAGNFIASALIGTISPTAAPTLGLPTLAAATDSGVSSSDDITNFDNSSVAKALQLIVAPTVIGETVEIFADGVRIGTAVATSTTTTVTTNGAAALAAGRTPSPPNSLYQAGSKAVLRLR